MLVGDQREGYQMWGGGEEPSPGSEGRSLRRMMLKVRPEE